jgi:UDP-glucose 4-epimerase
MKVLVTGGAGYIGSHVSYMLGQLGHLVVIFDNLSTGYQDAVLTNHFIKGDLGSEEDLDSLFNSFDFDIVMHLAGSISVAESIINPSLYYLNNTSNTLKLLNAMKKHGVNNLIFSSTAAIYGNPLSRFIDETHPLSPINPYGKSKLYSEQIIQDFANSYELNFSILRYFNAAGALSEGLLGERHEPETHLIPLAIKVALGKIDELNIFGSDHPTPDGTCVRDFVHVEDISEAHIFALNNITGRAKNNIYNIGSGSGYSVKETIEMINSFFGKEINISYKEKRSGDPSILVADSEKIRKELGWEPKYTLADIVKHAANWELKN